MTDKTLVHLFITGLISQITTSAQIATLGGQTPPASDPGQDVGVVFNWNNGSVGKTGFYGFQRSTGKFAFLPDSTVAGGIYSGGAGTLIANLQGNADTASAATKLATARTIAATGDLTWTSPAFDGTGNVTAAATLAATGVSAGTYNGGATAHIPMTFDAKGRLVSTAVPVTITPLWTSIQSTPTTLSGYGITDGVRSVNLTQPAQGLTVSGGPITSSGSITLALANDLAAVEGLTATGLVRRTATDTWSAGTPVSLTTEVTGNLPVGNLAGGVSAGVTTFWRGDASWSTAVTAVTITAANGITGAVATQGTTPAITLTLGAITPTSVAATGALSGTTIGGTTITASVGLVGPGSGITALNAANLGSGTVPIARLGASGTASATTYLAGDNSWKTTPLGSVTAVTVTTGNGVSAAVATQGTTPALTFTLGDITPTSVVSTGVLSGTTITASTGLVGPGSGITALNASNLASGTVAIARLGATGVAGVTTFLRGDNAWSTAVTAVTITTGNGVSGAVATQGTTPAITLTLGDITPTSVASTGALSGTTIGGTTITASGGFVGPGSGITALNASNLGSGTVPIARLGASGTASATTYLAGDNSWKTTPLGSVTSVSVVTANGVSGTVATNTTTPALTITLGAITPSSVASTGAVSGTAFTGTSFAGDGSALTGLAAGNIATGTVAPARLGSGTPSATTFLTGASTYVTAVTAVSVATANGVSGSATATGTPAITIVLGAITPTSVAATGAVSGATLAGAGSAITALNASNLSSGTVPLAQLGTGTPSATTFLSGTNAWATAVTTLSVTTANGVSGAIGGTATAPTITLTLGAITPSSVTSTGDIGGVNATFSGTLYVNTTTTLNGYTYALGLTTGTSGLLINGTATFNDAITVPSNSVAASNIDCATGTFFYKTATGVNTWTATNVPASGQVYEFTLELTNGGLGTQTWMTGTKWSGGVIPTLTAAGVDVLSFYTRDGGTTWRGTAVDIDSK